MPDLRDFIERTFVASGGMLPFDEFMAAALYDPEHGYYTTGIDEVGGRGGDFATSTTLSDGLATAIAGWIAEESKRLGGSGPVAIIEVGGGNGNLACGILKTLGWWRRRSIHYHLVEVSPVLRELQRRRLGRSVTWHETITDTLDAVRGKALIFSNELVDAFPAKWLRWTSGRWAEIHVAHDPNHGLREVFREPAPALTSMEFSALALTGLPEGQRIEILPSFRKWLHDLAPHWREGSMLTIDYGGDSAEAVYDRRPRGTMRGYFRQQRIEGSGIYARFGRQDLTTDVNFADLVRWGEELNWATTRLSTQREFLQRHGAGTDLTAGDGVGEAFRVLEQRRTN